MFNPFSPSSRTSTPLFTMGRWPISTVTLLIVLHSAAMIATALLMSLGHASWVNALCYSSSAVWQGQVLRLFTYAFINPPSIWFALEMMMLYYFGRELERALGSKMFGFLYAGLILLGPLLLQCMSLLGTAQHLSGGQSVNFAIFAAFVALYPTLPFLFGVTARWMLLAFVTLSALQFLEAHQFTSLVVFLGESLGAVFFMRTQGYQSLFPAASLPFASKLLKKIPFCNAGKKGPLPPKNPTAAPNGSLLGSCSTTTSFVPIFTEQPSRVQSKAPVPKPIINIDSVLEKISQTGMESLTEQEKEQLEKASLALVERDKGMK